MLLSVMNSSACNGYLLTHPVRFGFSLYCNIAILILKNKLQFPMEQMSLMYQAEGEYNKNCLIIFTNLHQAISII
jgi:hypothetical protein